MKKFKKMMAIVLSLAVVLAFSVPMMAFAADGFTITIAKDTSDKAAHTYGAYQLFKGDLAEKDGKKILSNVQWGDNVNGATVITELNKLEGFSIAANASAQDVAKAIADKNYTDNGDEAKALAEALNTAITGNPKGTCNIAADGTSGTIEGLPAGYYLVKDTAAVTGEGAQTKYIMEVVSNVSVTEKGSVPSVDKEIAETTPTKVSDYSVGDEIPYTITGTLPSNFAEYKTYKTFTFTDIFSAGLTAPAATAVTVKIGNDDITGLFDIAITGAATEEQTMTVTLKEGVDLKTAKHGTGDGTAFAAGDKIVVSYSATLNDSAVIGGTGNINTANLEFSNNPNNDGDGEKGTTPDDITVVFTYTIKALKVEPTEDAAITAEAYADLTDEQKKDYVKVGDQYQKVQALEGAGFTLYKGSKSDANKVAEITEGSTFEFKGVDAGTYILSETTVPEGYNAVPDITIVVTAVYDTTTNPATIESLTCEPSEFVATAATGVVEGKILNQQGSELPSTGGIGTTIFYVLGALLVVGAGVLLVTRRRMKTN